MCLRKNVFSFISTMRIEILLFCCLGFQSGEERPEGGCGADEAQRPQLQTRSGGLAGSFAVSLLESFLHLSVFPC